MTSTIGVGAATQPSCYLNNNTNITINNINNNNNNTKTNRRNSIPLIKTIDNNDKGGSKQQQQQQQRCVVVPDSTTTPQFDKDMNDFQIGEDVLVKQKDGRYYLGTIVQVSCLSKECLIKFGDNTDRWAKFKTLTKLNTSEQENFLLCVICKKSSPKHQHDITICDQCGRGYHQYCHQPKISEEYRKDDAVWLCRRCLNAESEKWRKVDVKFIKNRKSKSSSSSSSSSSSCSSSSDASLSTVTTTKVLPYDLNSLIWDANHRVNTEHIYCYCGETGEWYKQMLQCGRCKQWFHERCIDSLQYPLYCGDRFYVFVCSICNHGKEFVRRLEMKWVDLVHLMLFNLTAYNSRKYYDLDTTIIPYINDNWHALQLPPKISNVSESERRETILSILTSNRNRFKCGREIKKRVTIWGLRIRLPPPTPTISLNFNGQVTEEKLREHWQGNRRLQFLSIVHQPSSLLLHHHHKQQQQQQQQHRQQNEYYNGNISNNNNNNNKYKKLIPCDNYMKNVMMGVAYQHNNSNNPSETDSPCPSPEIEQQQQQQQDEYINNNRYDNHLPITRGCAKKSVPTTTTTTTRRKRLLTINGRERVLRKSKQRCNNSNDDNISNNNNNDRIIIQDDLITRGGYPTRLSLDNRNYQKNETLPLTPPTSVSAPSTPPALSSTTTTTTLLSDISNDFGENSNSLDKNLNNNNNNNIPYDTSGDETSSKSTLDLIIPPPKDFEGKNNPFLTLLKCNNEQLKTTSTKKNRNKKDQKQQQQQPSLPLPLTAVIPGKPLMRPTKRQLSEKDIFIGPNGEVKRKRLRRNRTNYLTNNSNVGQTASKTATVLPVKPDAKEWKQLTTTNNDNNVDYSFNGRKLRQRPDKIQIDKDNTTKINQTNTLNSNNNSNTNNSNGNNLKDDINIVDLKSSVNIYFGAANRIAAGEKFTIKAKRIGPTGKLEFLIEWDGGTNNSMT